MLRKEDLTGVATTTALWANIIGWVGLAVGPMGVVKALTPPGPRRLAASKQVFGLAQGWLDTNHRIFERLHHIDPIVDWQGVDALIDRRKSYLLLANHQSWADIPLLMEVFRGKASFPRFFLKHELLYVPMVGVACWAMDFPFMRRYPAEVLKAKPELAARDRETTRKACAVFQESPALVVNFAEGTRFTPAKSAEINAPYRHLLKPKAGGTAFTLAAMGGMFAGVLDVTIAYDADPERPLAWSFLSGRQRRARVSVRLRDVPPDLQGAKDLNDPAFRKRTESWLNELWRQKDTLLDTMKARAAQVGTAP